MKTSISNRIIRSLGRFFLSGMVACSLFACQKEVVNQPNTNVPAVAAAASLGNFQVGNSSVTLLQGNETQTATSLHWTGTSNTSYTVEAAPYGDNFVDMIELGTTDQTGMNITVKDLNRIASQIVPAGQTGMIELRVRANNGKTDHIYTSATALRVTTYLNFVDYPAQQQIRIPGNYQNWILAEAPHILSVANDGQFEGFIQFTNAYPQFLMVKDATWNPLNTYTYIGNSKIGFNGTMFSIFGGAGMYQVKTNTNTNTWSYSKINTWGVHGTAVKNNSQTDPQMTADETNMVWTINTDLVAGNFRIRANNNDAISYGKTMSDGFIVPDSKGVDFNITNPGNYKIVINLSLAGNYTCTVVKNVTN